MKKFKSLISCLLAVIILISACSIASFAFVPEEEFNIENVTWEDIMTMSNSDFRKLLSDFERVYDPFGTYETDPIMQSALKLYNSPWGVQPLWKSGEYDQDGNLVSTASHELITARACGLVSADKGFWLSDEQNESYSILAALMISLASSIPDTNKTLGLNQAYKGHFYDPDTEKNFRGESDNTAKTNAEKYYNAALVTYKNMAEKNMSEDFVRNIGMMLHYVQDACEPHHAANIISLGDGSAHGAFEKFADKRINDDIDVIQTMPNNLYVSALNTSIGTIVHDSAVIAKGYSGAVNSILFRNQWGTVAMNTSRLALYRSAMAIYKLYYNTKF